MRHLMVATAACMFFAGSALSQTAPPKGEKDTTDQKGSGSGSGVDMKGKDQKGKDQKGSGSGTGIDMKGKDQKGSGSGMDMRMMMPDSSDSTSTAGYG